MYKLIKEDGVHDSVVSDYHFHSMTQLDSALYEEYDDEAEKKLAPETTIEEAVHDVISEVIDHVITQADLDANPDLEKEGVKLGDTVQFTKESDIK